MSIMNLNEFKFDTSKKYYWSPSVRWEKTENGIQIEMFLYKNPYDKLFPKLYFLTQRGISIEELLIEFSEFDSYKLAAFLDDLILKRIFVSSIMSFAEIFYPQSHLFINEYSENIKYDANELYKFKVKQLNRKIEVGIDSPKIKLNNDIFPDYISKRKTCRNFDSSSKISLKSFSKIISVLRQEKSEEHIKYNYASAGGLYPIDIYIYIKDSRIEGIQKGLYYYSPINNELELLDETCLITKDVHYFTNQAIFQNSAFSIFLIYNAEATMPKYDGMAYLYAGIDSGLIVGTLTLVAEQNNIGICSIGDLNFEKIKKYFKLNENQILVHELEMGLKQEEMNSEEELVVF